jgi:hypothetical protein
MSRLTRVALAALAATAAALTLPACLAEPDVGAPLAGACEPADSDPSKDISFARDLRPLFDRTRGEGGCGCHGAGGQGATIGGFDMTTLRSIRAGGVTSGTRIIVPGNPCDSDLVHKMSAAPPQGARMPLDGPPFFTDEEMQMLHDWIAEGAKDN